ncbi:hypothetical protein ACVWYF_000954 [Hymenobacter sp. UYAg731]
MKKTLFTLALLAGLTGAAQAQRSNVSLGLKAGATYSNFVGKQAFSEESIFGFHAGVFANIGLTDLFAFQPEIIYSQKGSNPNITDFKNRLHYVDVPLAFHVNADGLFFEAGPQVGFLVAAQQKTGNTSTDIKARYNTIDFGYLAGLGYQRKTGLGIGLRYNGGFINVPKSYTVGNVTVQDNVRNSAFQLYLTYSFGG